jgi:hypothetical protein
VIDGTRVSSKGGETSEFLEVDGVLATRSNWMWSSDRTITTPIVFVGVHHSDGASREFTAPMARRLHGSRSRHQFRLVIHRGSGRFCSHGRGRGGRVMRPFYRANRHA